jgi:hypothetical protein
MSRADIRRAGVQRNRNGAVRAAACCRIKPCARHEAVNGLLLEVRKAGKWQPLGVMGRDGQWVIRKDPGKAVEL